MTEIKAFAPGSKVLVNKAEATIQSVIYRPTHIRYEVGYWLNNSWVEVWLPENEIATLPTETFNLGFK